MIAKSHARALAFSLLMARTMLRSTSFLCLLSSSALAGSLSTPVVGGTEVPHGTWPDTVAVIGKQGLCSGTLIAADLVLTAGHCIGIEPYAVIVDTIDYTSPGGDRRDVKWARAYPDWESTYDVGILMLENPVAVQPRAVAQACKLAAAMPVQVVGFGLTTEAGIGANTRLHQATIPVVDATCTRDPVCATSVAPGGEFTAGGRGADSCFGDSGGPVFMDTKHGAALIGVVSRATGTESAPCGGGGVYVRADKVVPWIEKQSGRKLVRAKCDGPADDAGAVDDEGGCSAGGGVLESGFAIVFAAMAIASLRRRSKRRS